MTAHRTFATIVVVLTAAFAWSGGESAKLKSGPQVGSKITEQFEVKLCNGPDAGDSQCLV